MPSGSADWAATREIHGPAEAASAAPPAPRASDLRKWRREAERVENGASFGITGAGLIWG